MTAKSSHMCTVRVTFAITFVKTCWIASIITSKSIEGATEGRAQWADAVLSHIMSRQRVGASAELLSPAGSISTAQGAALSVSSSQQDITAVTLALPRGESRLSGIALACGGGALAAAVPVGMRYGLGAVLVLALTVALVVLLAGPAARLGRHLSRRLRVAIVASDTSAGFTAAFHADAVQFHSQCLLERLSSGEKVPRAADVLRTLERVASALRALE